MCPSCAGQHFVLLLVHRVTPGTPAAFWCSQTGVHCCARPCPASNMHIVCVACGKNAGKQAGSRSLRRAALFMIMMSDQTKHIVSDSMRRCSAYVWHVHRLMLGMLSLTSCRTQLTTCRQPNRLAPRQQTWQAHCDIYHDTHGSWNVGMTHLPSEGPLIQACHCVPA